MLYEVITIQHDIVGTGNAHNKITAGNAQQSQQSIHIVLIGIVV